LKTFPKFVIQYSLGISWGFLFLIGIPANPLVFQLDYDVVTGPEGNG